MPQVEKDLALSLVRITLLGSRGVGKTKLIDSFINNTPPEAAWPLAPTTTNELYYRTVMSKNQANEDTAVMLEIEDTPGVINLDAADEKMELYISGDQDLELLVAKSTVPKVTAVPPFSVFENPYQHETERRPITPYRMAYLIVFDITNPQSVQDAFALYERIKWHKENVSQTMLVLAYVCATKTDLMLSSEQSPLVESWVNQNMLNFFRVSGLNGSGVYKMFNAICAHVVNTPLVIRSLKTVEDADSVSGSGDSASSSDDLVREYYQQAENIDF